MFSITDQVELIMRQLGVETGLDGGAESTISMPVNRVDYFNDLAAVHSTGVPVPVTFVSTASDPSLALEY